ncbi:hypothetical protein F4779DRAFT_238252 [Xylariaceae sp. FL0662B]|nr:hypothetical protein F4779DRAFT_238252 [Xylariaceae sp. FL0662B]
MRSVHRVVVVTDATMSQLGVVGRIRDVLNRRLDTVTVQVIDTIESEPTINMVEAGSCISITAVRAGCYCDRIVHIRCT